MDLSRLNELKEQKAQKEEEILERDENGKPVAGRYPWGDSEECPETNEIKEPLYQESLENGVEIVQEEEDDFTILDIDQGVEAIHLTPEQERKAQDEAVARTSAWMKSHPHYTMDELKAVKAGFLEEARKNMNA